MLQPELQFRFKIFRTPPKARQAKELGFEFPYCFDETQEVGKIYHAACTPDFFLFDQNQKLVYRGQMDDSRPGNSEPIDGHGLRAAIEAVLIGSPVSKDQKPGIGCSIKWKRPEPKEGFEPSTCCLQNSYSTTELLRRESNFNKSKKLLEVEPPLEED